MEERKFLEALCDVAPPYSAHLVESHVRDALRVTGLTLAPEGDPWALAAAAGDIVAYALSRNHGVRLAAYFDIVAGLMRGNPESFKVGFPAAGALGLACRVLALTNEERDELRSALDSCITRDLNEGEVPAGL